VSVTVNFGVFSIPDPLKVATVFPAVTGGAVVAGAGCGVSGGKIVTFQAAQSLPSLSALAVSPAPPLLMPDVQAAKSPDSGWVVSANVCRRPASPATDSLELPFSQAARDLQAARADTVPTAEVAFALAFGEAAGALAVDEDAVPHAARPATATAMRTITGSLLRLVMPY
jgi:hypothetical protein